MANIEYHSALIWFLYQELKTLSYLPPSPKPQNTPFIYSSHFSPARQLFSLHLIYSISNREKTLWLKLSLHMHTYKPANTVPLHTAMAASLGMMDGCFARTVSHGHPLPLDPFLYLITWQWEYQAIKLHFHP